jgi:hypothetical protein
MKPTAYFPFAAVTPSSEYQEHSVPNFPAKPQSHPYFPDSTPLDGSPTDDTVY